MANFYTEVPELKYHLNNSMMERICELKERGYQDKDKYDYAPQDYADAMDSLTRYLKSPERLPERLSLPMPRAWSEEGPHCANGRVEYASGTKQNLERHGKSRIERYDHAAPFRWLELPDYSVHHVCGNRCRRRCRFR